MNDHRGLVIAAAALVAVGAVLVVGCPGSSGEVADDEQPTEVGEQAGETADDQSTDEETDDLAVEEPLVDEVDRSGWSDERLQLEEDFRQLAVEARRLTEPADDGAELELVLEEILETDEELRGRFEEFIGRQEPEKAAWALLRTGQGIVIVGCNLVKSPVPDGLTAEQREHYQMLLDDQAAELVAPGREAFGQVVEFSAEADETDAQLQLWRWRADRWERELAEADNPRDGCEAVEDAWRADAME